MKNEIKETFKNDNDKNNYYINCKIRKNLNIKKYLDEQLLIFPEFGNPSNLVKCIINNIEYNDLPKCKTCGKHVKYDKLKNVKYCSCKCRSNNKDLREQTDNTNLARYGSKQIWASEVIKNKIKINCLEKYGVDHIGKHATSHKKQQETMLNIYGVRTSLQRPEIRNKAKINLLSKAYKNLDRYDNNVIPNFTEEEFINNRLANKNYEFEWKCLKCNTIFKQCFYKNCKFTRCYVCYPLLNNGHSLLETSILNYIKMFKIEIEQSNHKIIKPQELDIVIPAKNIAIEFNGNYWHTEARGKLENYHLDKTTACKNVGYRLIHIFEDEWINKEKIVKARLRNILGLTKYKIYARKCEVREIDNKTKNEFLEKYHIQGSDKSSIKLGLFYKSKLVAIMTFGARRFDDKEGFELIRYATIANFNIIGGAGKLLANFRKSHINETIISYADKRWSQGNLYKKLGFTLIRESTPNYFYIHNNDKLNRLSRMQFQKHKLKNILEKYDESLTEWQNMENNGYDRIWDCGNYVFELK